MSLRTALLVLAIVPGVALAALWAVTSGQTLLDFQRQAAQGQLAQQAGQPSNIVYYNLQEERRLSADALARPGGTTEELDKQRALTDEAIKTFQSLSGVTADDAPSEVKDAVSQARDAINQLPAQRTLVDEGDNKQQQAVYRYYTDLIAVDLKLFTALSHVDNGKVTTLSQPLVDLFWTKEMISRTDALMARGWSKGELSTDDLQEIRQAVSGQSFQYSTKVVPYLPSDEKAMWEEIVNGPAWKAKTKAEEKVLRPVEPDSSGFVPVGVKQETWRTAMDQLTPQLVKLLEHRTDLVVENGKGSVISLLLKMVLTTVVGLVAVIAVILTTWRLTRNLRRRIRRLQERAEELEKTLPDVVERLGQGERIDVEAEARAIESDKRGGKADELTQLGDALNLARTSALQAAVKQADQHRGFERLLQRIARRTQQLIGQQLKKLDELERKHEDPEVLDGLFDLDHLTARLRRYEENLVILSGGSPHRKWRKPVPLLDVMRSAQGEVQDYRRVVLDLDGAPWLSERAVGPVSHVLAELIENALTFSRPPSPVEVRAAKVSRGLAIEVEDRGLGMEEDQLAEANELMSRPPRMDVLAHSEDIRLGLYVIARLADQYGLRVEFRQSAFGGTRVVVLVPDELTVPEPHGRPVAVPAMAAADTSAAGGPSRSGPRSGKASGGSAPSEPGELPTRVQGQALADVTTLIQPDRSSQQQSSSQRSTETYTAPDQPYQESDRSYQEPDQAYREPDRPYQQQEPDQRYPASDDGPYPAAGDAYSRSEDTYADSGASYHGRQEDPYATSETPYATADGPYADQEQPYMTAEGQYPVPERPYLTSQGQYPGSEERFSGSDSPYTSSEPYNEPYTGSYPVAADDDRPSYGPPASFGSAPRYEESAHAHASQPSLEVAGHPDRAELESAADRSTVPGSGGEPPLPRRVRQASLADELRLDPAATRSAAPRPPSWEENPLLRPAPRRAGAAIGAFQRRSRAARASEEPTAPSDPPASPLPTREERS
ncbi:nitrate- and nitrite sensing domain-containing protein [Streptomyces sp. DT24]|uniref:sensor histidine kinase n=1 Tax=Streptomyces sp. DT24 TaxID=3416520 RepID=UPI003CF3F003